MVRNTSVRAPRGRSRRYSPLSSVRVLWEVPPTSTRAAGTGDASLVLTTRPRTLSGVCAAPTTAGTSERRNRASADRYRGPSPDERVIRPSEWCGKTVVLGGRTRWQIGKSHADASRVARRTEECEFLRGDRACTLFSTAERPIGW